MNKYIARFSTAVIFSIISAFCASAGTITLQTFDDNPTLSAGQAPGTWYVDRYAPAGFSSVGGSLALTLSASDNSIGRDPTQSPTGLGIPFYKTQGRKYDTPGANVLAIDMYIAADFHNVVGRIGGLWGSATSNGDPADYTFPIIEFFDNEFQIWESGNGPTAGWHAVGLPTGFTYDEFVNLRIVLDAVTDEVNFYIAGQLLETIGAVGQTSFANAIIQGINEEPGVNRTLYFDNFEASAVPIPAALPLFGGGLALMGFFGWRKRRKAQAIAA